MYMHRSTKIWTNRANYLLLSNAFLQQSCSLNINEPFCLAKMKQTRKSFCTRNMVLKASDSSYLSSLCNHSIHFLALCSLKQYDIAKVSIGMFSTNERKRKDKSPKVTIDSFGAWDNNFELPLSMEASIEQGKLIPKITAGDIGISNDIGKRSYQEDRYFVKDFPKDILCCAVFDGHGGSACSHFCMENIERILKSKLEDNQHDLNIVIHDTILDLNSSFLQWVEENSKGNRSGTTCTICLIREGHEMVIGHVGDSRALLCRRGTPRRLTVDHCPSNLSERKRIEQSGGSVATDNIGRHMVNETLSMSRSIGDLHLKPFGVITMPDTRKLEIKHGHDSFLLLATDGINYVLNDEEICNIINQAQDPSSAAKALTEQAISMASEDNLTALVLPFGSWGNFSKSAASMFYSFGIGRDMAKSSRFG